MSESKEPPRLPVVVDEAGPSPGWLPWLGFGLLCLCALLVAARQVMVEKSGDAPASELAAGAEEAAAAGAGAQPAAKPEPAAAQH